MKILEAQSALLTNFELSRFVQSQKERYAGETPPRRPPANMDTLVKEVQSYLRTFPNPLHEPIDKDCVEYSPYHTYSDAAIRELTMRLGPYSITKAELVAIFNMRPENMAILLSIIEDADDRWSTTQQKEMLDIITALLGRFPEEMRVHYSTRKDSEASASQQAEEMES